MGGQTTKYLKKGMNYVTGVSSEEPGCSTALDCHPNFAFKGTPFVLTRSSSQYFDEDGHLAHEFYRETSDKGSAGRVRLKRITKGLHKQGEIKLKVPRLNVDFPIVIYEG